MQGNRKRDTGPELALRRALYARGLRYRVAQPPITGLRATADVVFTRARVAVFVDGCFWHACPEHFSAPRTNASYWGPKIQRNRMRDARVNAELSAAGWAVIRIWEHEPSQVAADMIARTVASRLTDIA